MLNSLLKKDNKHWLIAWLVLLFSWLVLTGCASTPVAQQAASPAPSVPSWGNRVQVLSNIQAWDLDALIAIRANAAHNAGSANLQWKQSKQDYHILLFGPLGSNAITLAGKPGSVSLETADGKTFTAATPEALLLQQSGWHLPVSNLFYWIRGLPVPHVPAKKQLDAANHLSTLSQQGWTIQYQRYKRVGKIDMPDKILLANANVNVKIVIKSWQF